MSSISIPAEGKKKEFVNYIHNFRGLAIIFVVAGHVLLNWAPGSSVHLFFRVFWENGTVLFIFIAGYLFQYLSRKFEYRDYLVKKLKYVIVPYLIVSLPIILFRVIKHDYPGYLLEQFPDFGTNPVWRQVAQFVFTGAHMQQFWFIPMISIIYLLAPALLYIDRHPGLYWLLIPLMILSLLVVREPLNDIPRMFAHFLSTYVFGMLMSRYRTAYLDLARKYWVLITALTILTIAVAIHFYPGYNSPLNYLQKTVFCCFCIYWLWRLDAYLPKFLATLADVSFGIYFVHYYLVLAVRAIFLKLFKYQMPGNIGYWLISVVIVLTGSVLFIKAVRRLTGKNSRYLIGC